MQRTLKTLCLTLGLVLVLNTVAAAAEKINVGVPNWPSARAIANIIKVVLEGELGYEAGLVPGSNPVIYKAMDAGKGDIDVHPDTWMPNQANLRKEYVEKRGTVELNTTPYHGNQGMCVPRYLRDEMGVRSIEDLLKPEVVRMLDRDRDGKGEIWIGATGWASTNVEKVKARDYGYTDLYEPSTIDETLIYAQLGQRYAKKEPIVLHCYTPHWIHFKYDMVFLEEPPYKEGCLKVIQPNEDPDWFHKSKANCAWKTADVYVAFSKSLRKRAPEVARFLEHISLDEKQVSALTHAIAVEKRDAAAVAKEWVAQNRATVDTWLGLN